MNCNCLQLQCLLNSSSLSVSLAPNWAAHCIDPCAHCAEWVLVPTVCRKCNKFQLFMLLKCALKWIVNLVWLLLLLRLFFCLSHSLCKKAAHLKIRSHFLGKIALNFPTTLSPAICVCACVCEGHKNGFTLNHTRRMHILPGYSGHLAPQQTHLAPTGFTWFTCSAPLHAHFVH